MYIYLYIIHILFLFQKAKSQLIHTRLLLKTSYEIKRYAIQQFTIRQYYLQVEAYNMFNFYLPLFQYTELWKIASDEKETLLKSWQVIYGDMKSIGVVTFLNMFETHPETISAFIKDVYSIKELEMNEWYVICNMSQIIF